MKKSKFDEFINFYDQETQGKDAYYYRRLWDACQYADQSYAVCHKEKVWESKEYAKWVKAFKYGLKEQVKEECVYNNVCKKIDEWIQTL